MSVRKIAAGLLLAAATLVTGAVAAPAASAGVGRVGRSAHDGHGLIVRDRQGPDRRNPCGGH